MSRRSMTLVAGGVAAVLAVAAAVVWTRSGDSRPVETRAATTSTSSATTSTTASTTTSSPSTTAAATPATSAVHDAPTTVPGTTAAPPDTGPRVGVAGAVVLL